VGLVAEIRDSVQRIHGKYDLDSQITHRRLGHGVGMKSPTFRRYSSAGTDWAAWVIDRHSGGAWGVGTALLN
jgi:hypothetical protein